jgi:hypothetical protein
VLADKTTFGKHYCNNELAWLWGLGREILHKHLKDDLGVVKIQMGRKADSLLAHFPVEIPPVRQLIKAKDVALKLGGSVSWVIQHASGKRQPYLPAVKMRLGRSPLRFDPRDVEEVYQSVPRSGRISRP